MNPMLLGLADAPAPQTPCQYNAYVLKETKHRHQSSLLITIVPFRYALLFQNSELVQSLPNATVLLQYPPIHTQPIQPF